MHINGIFLKIIEPVIRISLRNYAIAIPEDPDLFRIQGGGIYAHLCKVLVCDPVDTCCISCHAIP